MNNKLLTTIGACLIATSSLCAQSYDQKIAEAMNASNWFTLDSIYQAAPKDSITPFLEVFARGLIGSRFNRPDMSLPAYNELLNSYSQQLDMGQGISIAVMFSNDLSQIGDNKSAAMVMSMMLDATRQYLDANTINGLQSLVNRYNALSDYTPYSVMIEEENGNVPFSIVPVGKSDGDGVHIHFDDSFINGQSADIMFDTGAGANVISDSLARTYNLTMLDVTGVVAGGGKQSARIAIAKELRLGNITLTDVPFYVTDIKSKNDEADQYMRGFDIIVGSDLMLHLKDVTIDFVNRMVTAPGVVPVKTTALPNFFLSEGMNLIAKVEVRDSDVLMNVDSGDASYGSLGESFFKANEDFIKSNSKIDTIRRAGIGGVDITECYKVSDMQLSFGGNSVIVPSLSILPKSSSFGYECNLGLKSLMLFDKVRFNLVDFVISTSK